MLTALQLVKRKPEENCSQMICLIYFQFFDCFCDVAFCVRLWSPGTAISRILRGTLKYYCSTFTTWPVLIEGFILQIRCQPFIRAEKRACPSTFFLPSGFPSSLFFLDICSIMSRSAFTSPPPLLPAAWAGAIPVVLLSGVWMFKTKRLTSQ